MPLTVSASSGEEIMGEVGQALICRSLKPTCSYGTRNLRLRPGRESQRTLDAESLSIEFDVDKELVLTRADIP